MARRLYSNEQFIRSGRHYQPNKIFQTFFSIIHTYDLIIVLLGTLRDLKSHSLVNFLIMLPRKATNDEHLINRWVWV